MTGSDASPVIGLLGPVAVALPSNETDISGIGRGLPSPADLRPVPGLRARRLLASLALANGRTRSAERLIDDVWGETPPRSPTAALHTQISRLRPLLGADRLEGSGSGYRLSHCRTDIEVVEMVLADADSAAVAGTAEWWRGVPGDDLGEDVPGGLVDDVRAAARLVEDLLDARRLTEALATRDYATARAIAEKCCAADSLDESAHLSLMRSLAGLGRVGDALAVYSGLRRRLSEQLGAEPGAQISALHGQLLAADRPSPEANEAPEVPTPAVAPRRARASGLRSETTGLIGRDSDIATVTELLADHRLVTVLGPGGVGKTRVINRVGNDLADTGRPVYYVALAPVRSNDDVLAAIAAALGVGETDISSSGRPRMAVGDLTDRLVDALRGRGAVLILDNCEQVVSGAAQVVSDLLVADPGLRVLTTSRAPLMLPAEQIFGLPVLDVGDNGPAVELFATRARSVRPDVRLPNAVVTEICRRLDGLPLAIELAAARTRTMTVEEIASRLAQRFGLLRAADRSAPDRHRTLHAVIEWSWELLDPEAQRAMRRLCRFPGGFGSTAAAVVLDESGFALHDVLESLVNQSLLTVTEGRDATMRYRMLETVREFGEEKLGTAGESDEVTGAMCRWAVLFAVSAENRYAEHSVTRELLECVGEEIDNLVWVLRTALAGVPEGARRSYTSLDPRTTVMIDTLVTVFPTASGWWSIRGLHGEVLTWGKSVLGVLPTPPADLLPEVRRRWQSTLLMSMGHMLTIRATRHAAIGRFMIRRLHRPELRNDDVLELLSACLLSRSTFEALRYVVRGVSSADADVAAVALGLQGNARENSGDLDGALRDAVLLRERALAAENDWFLAMAESSLGSIHSQQGQWAEAIIHFRVAIDGLTALGADDDQLQTRCYLSASLVALGRLAEAEAELSMVRAGWEPGDPDPQGNPEVAGAMMSGLADLELARGNTTLAADLFDRAATLMLTQHPLGTADPGLMMQVGSATIGLLHTGDLDRARRFLPDLAAGVTTMFSPNGWRDVPQAGMLAFAAGALLCTDPSTRADGARLIALAGRLRLRRDYRTVAAAWDDPAGFAGLGDAEWAAARDEAAHVPRRQAVDEIVTILAPLAP